MERVSAEALNVAVQRLFVAHGLSGEHALDVADTLVETSLDGVDTHGVRLIATYLRELECGRAKAYPVFRTTGTFAGTCVFDADDALGVVAGNAAMRETIQRATQCGIAATAVASSNHFGSAGYYARLAARRDQIGIVLSNSDALVVPAGGLKPLNGTNPIAIAAPALDGDGFHLDMATSQMSFSSRLHALAGELHPGADTRDPAILDAVVREIPITLPPLGGHKGQGLGMAVQILCALLADMPFDADLQNLYEPPLSRPRRISHFLIAIEIGAFLEPERFRARLSELLARFRNSPAAGDGVIVPGDQERRARAQRLREGIPLEPRERELLAPYLEPTEVAGR
jgi:ureidoglycolate dehydrogenase (NAD+)